MSPAVRREIEEAVQRIRHVWVPALQEFALDDPFDIIEGLEIQATKFEILLTEKERPKK